MHNMNVLCILNLNIFVLWFSECFTFCHCWLLFMLVVFVPTSAYVWLLIWFPLYPSNQVFLIIFSFLLLITTIAAQGTRYFALWINLECMTSMNQIMNRQDKVWPKHGNYSHFDTCTHPWWNTRDSKIHEMMVEKWQRWQKYRKAINNRWCNHNGVRALMCSWGGLGSTMISSLHSLSFVFFQIISI